MPHAGQSGARVTGPCSARDQAAGTAADLVLSAGVAVGEVDVAKLQARLQEDGAWLGGETR